MAAYRRVDGLKVICRLTAGLRDQTLADEYGRTLPFTFLRDNHCAYHRRIAKIPRVNITQENSAYADRARHGSRSLPTKCKTQHFCIYPMHWCSSVQNSGSQDTSLYDPGLLRHARSQYADLSCCASVSTYNHNSPTLQTDRQTDGRTDMRSLLYA